jgi:hypothetical protein
MNGIRVAKKRGYSKQRKRVSVLEVSKMKVTRQI